MSDYITLVGTIIFQRERSCYIRFDGVTTEGYKGQFVPKSKISGVDYEDSNLTDIDIRVSMWYYKLHIKWRLYGN